MSPHTKTFQFLILLASASLGSEAIAQPSASLAAEPPIRELTNSNTTPTEPNASPVSLQFSVQRFRDDGGYEITVPTVALRRSLARNVALIASLGTGSFRSLYDGDKSSNTRLFPLRFGVVGRSGALALELGMTMIPYRETTSCGKGAKATWDSSEGVHGAVRVHLPLGQTKRSAFIEVGAQMLLDDNHLSPCRTRLMAQAYGGWVGIGVSF